MSAQQERSDNQEAAGTTGASLQGRVVRVDDLAETVQTMVRQAMADGGRQQPPSTGDSGEWVMGSGRG